MPDDPDQTLPSTPLSKIVKKEFAAFERRLCGHLARMRTDITVDVVNAIAHDLRILKDGHRLNDERLGAQSTELKALRDDLDALQGRFNAFVLRHGQTEPPPPPEPGR